ncbi:MAG: 2-hydroxyglutaryl-CoA dehydratase [Clostridiales bacterium]|nr:2-hydroxyglutaryl-CoA dehydratase [Clostridiales bacterium]
MTELNTCYSMPSLGIDIGSTTAKVALIENGKLIYQRYERHYSFVRQKTLEMIRDMRELLRGKDFTVAISGSAGLGVAKTADIPFVQEVFATAEVVKQLEPDTYAVIELGGEDAKIIFFQGGTDERMNGSCAGGTGAFIDQMATLLDVSVGELDELSLQHERIYPIASRCGVFAKTDIQPLLNQGAKKEDIAASIYQAVVNQTIAGLAQGRSLDGKIMFLGGPLYFCKGLRERFVKTLKLADENAVFPEYARVSVAMGAAIFGGKEAKVYTFDRLVGALENATTQQAVSGRLSALFQTKEEYEAFCSRHAQASVDSVDPYTYTGDAYLGIDCGSTTTKLVLMSEEEKLLYTYYDSNKGNPVQIVKEQLHYINTLCADRIRIRGSAVTGYGEELIKNAFGVDSGLVETMAHFLAARHFDPQVDFILDIGGQDIKCFRIKNNSVDSIMLNEACSSGCGSFIETFAKSMGYEIGEFAKIGLQGKAPVDLGSRCTVFMNSSVKQAQKDGADVSDISAGLSISVVKNAVYKVIRAGSADELGSNIVVQGGTFYNDAVLRAFELELGRLVVRPTIAGLMGAYGAALHAKNTRRETSSLITPEGLAHFVHESKSTVCKGCTNRCHLTVNTFSSGQKFISGNQCERGLGIQKAPEEELPNLHEYKRGLLTSLPLGEGTRGVIGLPLALGMYELAPLWHAFYTALGFQVKITGLSNKKLYAKGQYSIPSDTVCYPAKLMHGHIVELIENKVDAVFYPRLTYNVDEGSGDNHYNCPVVAYYADLLAGNMDALKDTTFLYPYLNINSPKQLAKEMYQCLNGTLGTFTAREIKQAVKAGFAAYDAHMKAVRSYGERAIAWARAHGKRMMILAGRPYHIDAEIGHGIDKLATSLGFVVLSEDSVSHLCGGRVKVGVLDQWTYHTRLYRAAAFAAENNDVELVQLVSFGCGLDAVTTDEVRAILEDKGKLYTQIKIDEITNLGAVKIRLRSLIGALEERGKQFAD